MSRNKIIVLVFCVVLLAGVGVGFWFLTRPPLAMEEVFPSDVLFYTRIDKPLAQWEKFKATDFYKSLASIDFPKVMARNNVSEGQIREFSRGQQGLVEAFTQPWVSKIASKELAVGLYPNLSAAGLKDKYGILLAVRLDASVQAFELMSKVAGYWKEDVRVREEVYRGVRINFVTLNKSKREIVYFRLRDLMIIGLDGSLLKQSINAVMKQSPSLKSNLKFTAVMQHSYPVSEGIVFMNMETFSKELQARAKAWIPSTKGKEGDAAGLDNVFRQQEALVSYGASFTNQDGFKYKVITAVNPLKLTPEIKRLVECKGSLNSTAKFIPANAIIYNWSTCYDFQATWDQLKTQFASDPGVAQGQKMIANVFEKRFKINLEQDLLASLGDELGWYMTDVDTSNAFPFPRLLIFVKLKDRAKIDAILTKLTKNPLATLQDENYQGVPIRFMSLPFGPNMDPGYCFINDYLMIASSRQLLKISIEASKEEGRSLFQEKNYRLFGLHDGVAQSETFIRTGEFANRLVDVSNWFNRYLSQQISLADTYKEDARTKQKEIAAHETELKSDLKIARKKLSELQAMDVPLDVDGKKTDEALVNEGIINNLKREIATTEQEIQDGKATLRQIKTMAQQYDQQVAAAQAGIYNIDHILVPILKGFTGIEAQSMRINITDQMILGEVKSK